MENKIIIHRKPRIIGVCRGERNLITVCFMDEIGEPIFIRHFNSDKLKIIKKLKKKPKDNWQESDLDGQVKFVLDNFIRYLCKLMTSYDTIIPVAIELNKYAKRKKINQKDWEDFIMRFLNKLNFLVFKDKLDDEMGSVNNAFQLTKTAGKSKDELLKVGKQHGFVFIV